MGNEEKPDKMTEHSETKMKPRKEANGRKDFKRQ